MKASDLFVRCLEAEGVTRIFGVPGEENADFMMSLENSPIEFMLCRHEQGAAFAADAIGRLTGEAGVCLGTLGPGATNLITGVADANMDRAPLVAITGQAERGRLHKESHQAMDVVGMFRPVTKWAHSVTDPDAVPEVTRKAFKVATTEKPGATHLELPEDVAALSSEAAPLTPQRLRRSVPDDKIVDRAFAAIVGAKRPLLLAGNGAIRRRASHQLRAFVRHTGIGVATTFMGKGCVPREWPEHLFSVGLGARDLVARAIEEADLVITVGYDMVEYHPRLWNGGAKRVVHLDFLPAEIDAAYPVEVEVVGDIAHTLWMLNERWAAQHQTPDFDFQAQREAHNEMERELRLYCDDDTKGALRPQKILWDVREAMGPGDLLLSDVGAHKMWVARHYHCDEPNTCLISNGFCSMGFALPGAIGAKLAFPDRRVLAICGDGGFLMNVQEMESAVRFGTNIVAMVWEDRAYGLIEWKQQSQFGTHTDLRFENPDLLGLAKSFGWAGIRVDRSEDLRSGLERAFSADRPALLVVPVDYRENMLLTERLGRIQNAL